MTTIVTIAEPRFNLIINESTENLTIQDASTTITVLNTTTLGIRGIGFKTITVGATQPENPTIGDIWFNTN